MKPNTEWRRVRRTTKRREGDIGTETMQPKRIRLPPIAWALKRMCQHTPSACVAPRLVRLRHSPASSSLSLVSFICYLSRLVCLLALSHLVCLPGLPPALSFSHLVLTPHHSPASFPPRLVRLPRSPSASLVWTFKQPALGNPWSLRSNRSLLIGFLSRYAPFVSLALLLPHSLHLASSCPPTPLAIQPPTLLAYTLLWSAPCVSQLGRSPTNLIFSSRLSVVPPHSPYLTHLPHSLSPLIRGSKWSNL
jgi:hypothetical protein